MAAKRSKDADRKRVAEKRRAVGRSGGTRVGAESPSISPSASGATAPDTLAIKAPSSTTKNTTISGVSVPTNSMMSLAKVRTDGRSELVLLGPSVTAFWSPAMLGPLS